MFKGHTKQGEAARDILLAILLTAALLLLVAGPARGAAAADGNDDAAAVDQEAQDYQAVVHLTPWHATPGAGAAAKPAAKGQGNAQPAAPAANGGPAAPQAGPEGHLPPAATPDVTTGNAQPANFHKPLLHDQQGGMANPFGGAENDPFGGFGGMGGMGNPLGGMGGFGNPFGGMGGMGDDNPFGGMGGFGNPFGGMGGMGGDNPFGGMGGFGNPFGGMGGMGGFGDDNPFGGMGGMGGDNPFGGVGGMGGDNPFGGMGGFGGGSGGPGPFGPGAFGGGGMCSDVGGPGFGTPRGSMGGGPGRNPDWNGYHGQDGDYYKGMMDHAQDNAGTTDGTACDMWSDMSDAYMLEAHDAHQGSGGGHFYQEDLGGGWTSFVTAGNSYLYNNETGACIKYEPSGDDDDNDDSKPDKPAGGNSNSETSCQGPEDEGGGGAPVVTEADMGRLEEKIGGCTDPAGPDDHNGGQPDPSDGVRVPRQGCGDPDEDGGHGGAGLAEGISGGVRMPKGFLLVDPRPEEAGKGAAAEVVAVTGAAQKMVVADGKAKWAALAAGEKLGAFSVVRTGLGARVDLRFAHGATAAIGAATKVGIGAFGEGVAMRLKYGALQLDRGKHAAAGGFQVETPAGAVGLIGENGTVAYGQQTGLQLGGAAGAWDQVRPAAGMGDLAAAAGGAYVPKMGSAPAGGGAGLAGAGGPGGGPMILLTPGVGNTAPVTMPMGQMVLQKIQVKPNAGPGK